MKRFLEVMPLLQTAYLNLVCSSRDIRILLLLTEESVSMLKNQTLENETGFDTSIQIGGINKKCREDKIIPTVKLYMNDETLFLAV
jgi:hypothetical protein